MKVTQLPRSQPYFNPTNVELVNILRRKIERNKPSSFVTDIHHTLYEKEPWLLPHVRHVRFHENEWFYFVTRKQPPRAKKADSKRPCRKVIGLGRWKMSGILTQIEDKDGVNIGSVRNISFKAKSETEKDGITTGWGMHEFLLDKPGFQEVALCRIRFNPRKNTAQYAPRLTPIMIGLEREDGSSLVENHIQPSISHVVAASGGEETQYLDAPVETHQAQGMEQWNGSCSGESVSSSAPQHQQTHPILSGGMEQHQDFGSYGQQQNHILGHMEQYGQGFGDMFEYQNQYLGQGTTNSVQVPMMMNQALNEDQRWNEYFGLSSAHQEQHLAAQHQHLSVNASMEQHQGLGLFGQFLGESLGQQQNHVLGPQESYLSLMEDHQQQYPNLFWGQERNLSYSAQTMEEQQQWNGYSAPYLTQPYDQVIMENQHFGSSALCLAQTMEQQQQWNGYSAPYSAQPYDQGMIENQDFGSSALRLAQNHQNLGQNNDFSAVGEPTAQHQHSGEDLNFSLTQQQNQILGQATHLLPMGQQFWQTGYQSQLWGQHTDPSQVPVMMNQALEEQHYVQPYDHYKGQNNALPTVPMKTQQQQESVIGNSAAQLQLEEQENVPLVNQTMEEQAIDLPMNQGIGEPLGGIVGSPIHNELAQDLFKDEPHPEKDSEIANFGTEEWAQQLGRNTPEEEAELTAGLANCRTPYSLLDFFCPTNVK